MTEVRRTFLLEVHADGGAVLLDEQAREYVWMKDLHGLPEQIAGRLGADLRTSDADGGAPCFERD